MSEASSHQQPSPLLQAIGIALVVVVVQALIIPLFAAPAANLAPRDLPIVIAGQPQAAAGLTAAVERHATWSARTRRMGSDQRSLVLLMRCNDTVPVRLQSALDFWSLRTHSVKRLPRVVP